MGTRGTGMEDGTEAVAKGAGGANNHPWHGSRKQGIREFNEWDNTNTCLPAPPAIY